MTPPKIQPRTLKGFRDFLPEAMMPRERLIATAQQVYRSFGFAPIDTPALEYLEILTGKGSEETDRQLYRFEDQGGRRVGMRFDLTVPLARFVAQHVAKLGVPFKRYHIATVWRGENPQHGRYREFMQCDFDTVGTKSVVADIETAVVINELLRKIGFEKFTIHINNRMVLNGLLDQLDLSDKSGDVLRSLDKLSKIGPDKVVEEMVSAAGISEDRAREVLRLSATTGTNDEILSQIETLVGRNELGRNGVDRLSETIRGIRAAGVPDERIQLDVSIARGLDYYTGIVYETLLDELPSIGSVCSGGRYDNLAELFTKQQLPGVGASLGLDRLLAAMEKLGTLEVARTPAPILVVYLDEQRLGDYLGLASSLRSHGLGVEVYPEPKRMGQQLKYADRRGFLVALIAGEEEFETSSCQVKDLRTKQQHTVSLAGGLDALANTLHSLLDGSDAL